MTHFATSRRQRGKTRENRHASGNVVECLEPRTFLNGIAFGAAVTSNIATANFAVFTTAVGDLNGDKIPDVVSGRNNLEAQVYLGTSTGVLSPGNIYATGGAPVALGDFTGDNNLDLATTLGVLPGLGNGTFGPAIAGFTMPAYTVNLYAEDVNADGKLDLVAATFTPGSGTGSTATNPTVGLSVLLGNGNGTFKAPVSIQVGSGASITASDAVFAFGNFVNASNDLDIITPFGVMLSAGNGTYNAPVALPYKNSGTPFPAAPLFAVGDFNGDLNEDFATLPTAAGTGQVEIFLGNGKGGFTDNGPVTVTTGQTITSIATDDLLATGESDLLAGITATGGAGDVAVVSNSGNSNATFNLPVLYSVPGAPLSVSAQDFNGDGVPDLLTMNEAAGGLAGNQIVSASVLIGTANAGTVPTVNLRASANPVIAGNSVEFFANITAPAGSTLAMPTGSVTFYDGATALGSAPLVKGKANITTTAAGLGVQAITVKYSGDINYAAATSNTLNLTVLISGLKQPLLVPELGAVTLPAEFLPGDSGTVTVQITNGGNATGNGRVSLNLYLSPDGAIDSSAIPLTVPAFQNRVIHLNRGAATTITTKLVAGAYPAGTYSLVGQLVPVAGYTADQVSDAPVVNPITLQAAGMVFGTIGKHKGLKLKIADPSNNIATLTISGPGSGTVTVVNGVNQIAVTGVTTASTLNIVNKGAFTLGPVSITGSLNTIAAHSALLGSSLSVSGSVKTILLGGVAASDGTSVAINLGPGFTPTLNLGNVATATLTSAAPIKSLLVNSWQAGAIDAPSITALTVKGAFGANVNTHANGAVVMAKLGSITGGTWSVAGAITSLRVVGAVTNAVIFAGADSGRDDILGTSDDAFMANIIGTLLIGGPDTSSLIVAGGSVPAGTSPVFSGVALLPGGVIRNIVVKGVASADSHFLAAKLPRLANLNGVPTSTATDPRFQV